MPTVELIDPDILQLRGAAGDRQVAGQPKVALSHVYGEPGLSGCTILTR